MESLTGKNTGDTLTAFEWNQLPGEVQNAITSTGQALTNADLTQLVKAISIYSGSGTFYTDSGVSNAYVLSNVGTLGSPPTLVDGMIMRFIAGNSNTGATTVNPAGLGVLPVIDSNGAALTSGDIVGGRLNYLTYSVSAGSCILTKTGLNNVVDVTNGIGVVDPVGSTPILQLMSDALTSLAQIEGDNTGAMLFRSLINGNGMVFQGNDAGGTPREGLSFDPDGSFQAGHVGVTILQSLLGSAGGLQILNNLTGAGMERALTESDLTAAGDVSGPGSSTNNAVARWDGITGTVIQNALAIIADDGSFQNSFMQNVTAATGGLQANNQQTGIGLERVATESDLVGLGVTISATEIVIAGLVRIKYGTDSTASLNRAIPFPVAFPTACYGGMVVPYQTGGADASTYSAVQNFSTTSIDIYSGTTTGGGSQSPANCLWYAWGE